MPLFFLSHVLYSTLIHWLLLKGEQILIGLLEFHIVLSEILLTTCADQLLYNLRSQETLKFSHLKNVFFFLLYIVETSYGNAHIKF